MTLPTHILATAALAKVLRLSGFDLIWAYVFGLGIDLDHLLKAPRYYCQYRFKRKKYYHWRTPLQEPVSFLWIIPVAFLIGSIWPVVFFALHLFLDYLDSFPKLPFYPYSAWETRGFLPGVSPQIKESIVFIFALCIVLIPA